MASFDLAACARPNILALKPYHCARNDFDIDGSEILLDLNENAYGPSSDSTSPCNQPYCDRLQLHRYPDRLQLGLKGQFCKFRNAFVDEQRQLLPENVFLGVGSIEIIDALIRCFCTPGRDSVLTCPPTYGMYGVAARVNDVRTLEVPLKRGPSFALDVPAITRVLSSDPTVKLAFFASPGNPTGSLLSKIDIEAILAHPTWNGVVVVDEAYIDFADERASLAWLATAYPNVVIMQTLSKAFGMAGIRLGAAFASPQIAALLNKLQAPWNVPSPSAAFAMAALSAEGVSAMHRNRHRMKTQRDRLLKELPEIDGMGLLRGGADSNFLLFEVLNARGCPDNATAAAVYTHLARDKRIMVRFRGAEPGCFGCLRVSIGTEDEVTMFLQAIKEAIVELRNFGGVAEDTDSGVELSS